MSSIKPTPPLLLARSIVPWAHAAEQFVTQMELGTVTDFDRPRLRAAFLILNDHVERVKTLLSQGEQT